jgi:photosystem II stability/assembly factor-like uncharacterized protein
MKNIKLSSIIVVLIFSILFYSCDNDDTTGDGNYQITITNPIEGYSIAVGSNILLTVKSEYLIDQYEFYLDGNPISVSSADESYLFLNNKGYYWDTSNVSLGNHTLKSVAKTDGDKVGSTEISITFTPKKWEKIDLSNLLGNDYVVGDVFLLNDNIGWISARENYTNYILKTVDKGLTWQIITNNSEFWERFAFSDESDGVGIEYYANSLYSLNNGGTSSTQYIVPPYSYTTARSIAYTQTPNEITMIATRFNDDRECVYRINTLDNSIIQDIPIVPNSSTSGAFNLTFNQNIGVISSMINTNGNEYIYLTKDNGLTWNSTELPPPTGWLGGTNNYVIYTADIFDANNIWLVGSDSTDYLDSFIYKTSDGGDSWEAIPVENKLSFSLGSFSDVVLMSATEAYATIGSYTDLDILPKMYHTTDGGINWQPVYEVASIEYLNKIEFKGTNFGIAIGENKQLYRYKNN